MLSAYLGGIVFGEAYGTAPARVLALHGWGRTHEDFREVLSGSLPGAVPLDAIALDLPGFGASPPPPEVWGAEEYAASLRPLLEEMAERVVVVGHSFGGRVAIELARADPGRVGGLVLTGVPLVPARGRPARTKLAYRIVRSLAKVRLVGDARIERARQRYGSRDYREASGVMRGVLVRQLAEDYTESLRQLACPVELLWGANDTVAPPALARDACAVLKDGHLTELANVGHFIPTTAPRALYDAVARTAR
ncbi:MAG: alpha/beta hydrolase [Acidimicrobiales bacterium]